jgi:multimeric flavodoxin WrbA
VAARRGQPAPDLKVELLDLKDFDLPLFDEKASNLWLPSEDARATAWQEKIGEFDGYLVTVGEYNHSMTGALKNAFDQAYVEWGRKPIGFAGYGGVGGARRRARTQRGGRAADGAGAHGGAHRRRRLLRAVPGCQDHARDRGQPAARRPRHAGRDGLVGPGHRAARKRDADEAIAAAAA